jgi:hypothetical protein
MAKLHIDLLAEKLTEGDIHATLENLPEDLSKAYGSVMNRIAVQDKKQRDLAMTALKWVTYTKERLKAEALQHGLAVTPDSTEINDKDLIDIDLLVSFCMGIVTIDREGGTIRLVHYTVQNYLEKTLQSMEANTEIAKTCLSYLAFDVFSAPCENINSLKDRLKKYKLSNYAASHWADHARGKAEEHLQATVLATFESNGKCDSMLQLQDQSISWKFKSSYKWSPLHLASSNGLSHICQTLLNKYKRENILGRFMKHFRSYLRYITS